MKLPDQLKINVCTRKQNLALLEYNISFQTGLHSELTNDFTNSGPLKLQNNRGGVGVESFVIHKQALDRVFRVT